MIGLLGAQRVGKSTLAREFAKWQGIPFLECKTADLFKALDLDPKVDYPLPVRVASQRAILSFFVKIYEKAQKAAPVFVADRTPLDMAAYMLSDIQRTTVLPFGPEMAAMISDYVDECFRVTNRFFGTVILVQPGIPVVEREGSAPGCPVFMEHFNCVAAGLMLNDKLTSKPFAMPRKTVELEARKVWVAHAVSLAIDRQKSQTASMGLAVH